jgi:hypothetical protein
MALSAPRNVMVIGVGGTGKWILTYLKQSMIQANNHCLVNNSPLKSLDPEYGRSIPEGIKFLCLNLDNDELMIDQIKINYDQTLGDEFINFKADLSRIKDNVTQTYDKQQWPWFEPEDAQKLTISIGGQEEQGAGQQRQFSRLSLLENLAGKSKLIDVLNNQFTSFERRAVDDPSIPNYFVVVGSIAGGTGSGTILDIAQILKHQIETRPLRNSYIIGMAVLSETFAETFKTMQNQWQLVQANCLAAMREIRRFLVLTNSGYPFEEYDYKWNPSPRLSDKKAPFDVFYAVDGTRPNGKKLSHYNPGKTIYPAMADYLTNLCLQQDRPFDPSNTRNIISNTAEGVFSTLGCHKWIFPVDDIVKDFSIQLSTAFLGDLSREVEPTYNWDEATHHFLRNSHEFYAQNSPQEEFFIGQTQQTQKFGLLDEIANTIIDKEKNGIAPSIDVTFFTDKIFSSYNFPLRFVDPKINVPLTQGYEMPTLNLDHSGANDTDYFSSNPDIQGSSDQPQVVDLAKKLLQNNLGTSSDPIYEKSNPKLRRTYHSILKYYKKAASEIFGGYQDHRGNYYPGLLENQIFLLLNRIRQSQPRLNPLTNEHVKGEHTGNLLFDVEYQLNDRSIATVRRFCQELIISLGKSKAIIDEAYDLQMTHNGRSQVEIDQEEVSRREYDYLNSSLLSRFKKTPYLESMQRLLLSQRLVVMKRTFAAIIEDFIEIINGWLEAIKNFEETLSKLQNQLLRIYSEFIKDRSDNESIQTRTYLSTHQSSFERNLYRNLVEAADEQVVKEGQVVNISNKDRFYAKSHIAIGLNPMDVDTRPGIKRTGRELSVNFCHDKQKEVLSIPEVAVKYASYFCQGVRKTNFWSVLLQYRDDLEKRRYDLNVHNLPGLLVSDITDNSNTFINYAPAKRVRTITGTNDSNWVLYGDWANASGASIDTTALQTNLRSNQFSSILNANINAGQHYELTAIRQVYNLTIDSLHSFTNNLSIYRNWLVNTYEINKNVSTGTPLHVFLGEKYASIYENLIMQHWQALSLASPVLSDFFLPLGVVLALEKVDDIKDFLWAGVHMHKIYWTFDDKFGNHYAIKGNGDELIPLASTTKKDLVGALILFASPNDASSKHKVEALKKDIRQNRKEFMVSQNTNRGEFVKKLNEYLIDPVNQMIIMSGTENSERKKVLDSNSSRIPYELSGEEYMNILFKAMIYEQLIESQATEGR